MESNKISYPHPALDINKQIQLLINKGLVITNINLARHWLLHNGYFRFKNYSYTFKDYTTGKGSYVSSTTFEKVRDLYVFDRKLRMTVVDGIENIEISVKACISNIMSNVYGPHWYLNPEHFISAHERRQPTAKRKRKASTTFNHEKFILNLKKRLTNHFEPFLKEYKDAYIPVYPPSWMLMEILPFGTISRMFENLQPSAEKNQICKAFGLSKKQFVSWLHCFSFFRNRCAHHCRLVYSKINFAPSMPQKHHRRFLAQAEDVDHTSLYAVLCCIQYMLSICNNDSMFKYDLTRLLQKFPEVSSGRLGFTANWQTENIWTLHDLLS